MHKKVDTKTLIKSSFWYTLSSFLTKAIGFITIPIFTRILTNEQIGNFTNYTTWQGILIIICGLEVYNTLNRARFDFDKPKELDGYITSCVVLNITFTAAIFIAYILFKSFFYKLLLIDDKYMMIMFAYLFAFPSYSLFQMKQRIEYKYKLNSAIAFSLVLSSSALAVLLTKTLPDSLLGRIFGQYILYIIVGILFASRFIIKEYRVKTKYFIYAIQMGVPLVLSYLGSNILLGSDNFIVKHMCSSIEVSYLAIAHSTTHIILLFVQTLNGAWSPWYFDKLETKEYIIIKRTLRAYMWLIVLATLAVLLFGPEIIRILGGKNYSASLYILPVNIMGGIFTALKSQMVSLETYHKKPHYAAIITGICAITNLGLNVLAVKLFGYSGVCYATLVCHIMAITIHYFCTNKMGISSFLGLPDVVIYVVVSVVMIPISMLLYRFLIIRVIVIAGVFIALVAFLLVRRQEIITFVNRFRKNKGKRDEISNNIIV